MSIITMPEEQIQQTEAPALVPFYQFVKVSPINNITQIIINDNTSTQVLTFEIPGENVVNLSKCYLDYTLSEFKFNNKNVPAGNAYDVDYIMNNTFGLSSIRVYNTNGVNLFYVDETYNDYIDIMRRICRKTNEIYNNDDTYFDGYKRKWSTTRNKYVTDFNHRMEEYATKVVWDEVKNNDYDLYTNQHTLKIKLFFNELFNSILCLKTDI